MELPPDARTPHRHIATGSATGPYDASRGAAVFDATHRLLDELFPLRAGSWAEVTSLRIANGALLMGFGPEGNNLWAEEAPAEVSARARRGVGGRDGALHVHLPFVTASPEAEAHPPLAPGDS